MKQEKLEMDDFEEDTNRHWFYRNFIILREYLQKFEEKKF